jgi:hypothetical protein
MRSINFQHISVASSATTIRRRTAGSVLHKRLSLGWAFGGFSLTGAAYPASPLVPWSIESSQLVFAIFRYSIVDASGQLCYRTRTNFENGFRQSSGAIL